MGSFYLTPSGFSFRIVFTASQYYTPLLCCLPAHNLHRFRTGDIKLSVWLEHITDGEREKVSAFESVVTVVEPELSIFDFKLYVTLFNMNRANTDSSRAPSLSTYAMVLAILGGLGYIAYLSFVPQPKHKKTAPTPASESTVTATGAGGYQGEWIPEHHLRKAKARKVGGAVSSGDEQSGPSGAEASGTEGKRRSNRLRK
jgi:hypothetical protein